MDDLAKAIDDAIHYIAELLNKSLVKKWLTSNKCYRPFRELAKVFKKLDKKFQSPPFKAIVYEQNRDKIQSAITHRGWPKPRSVEDEMKNFHRVAAVEIKGPAKLIGLLIHNQKLLQYIGCLKKILKA